MTRDLKGGSGFFSGFSRQRYWQGSHSEQLPCEHAVTPAPLRVFLSEKKVFLRDGYLTLASPSPMWNLEFILARSWGKYICLSRVRKEPVLSHACVYTWHGILLPMVAPPPFHTSTSPASLLCGRTKEDHLWSCPALRVGREHRSTPSPLQTKPHLPRRNKVFRYFVFHSFLSNHCGTFYFTE